MQIYNLKPRSFLWIEKILYVVHFQCKEYASFLRKNYKIEIVIVYYEHDE